MEACAAGTELKSNRFFYNSPILFSSNGGAVSVECEFVTEATGARMGSSNTGFTAWNEKMNVYDPEDVKLESPMTLYMVYRYATSFISNQFIGNTIGQKGSAIYNRQGSIIIVE